MSPGLLLSFVPPLESTLLIMQRLVAVAVLLDALEILSHR